MVKVARPVTTTEPNCATPVYHPPDHPRYPTLWPLCRHRPFGPLSPTTTHGRHLPASVCPRTCLAPFYPPVLGCPTAPPRCRPSSQRFPRLALRTGLRTPTHYRCPSDLLPPGAVRPAPVVCVSAPDALGPRRGCFHRRLPRTP